MSRLRNQWRLLRPKILEWLSAGFLIALIVVPLSMLAWFVFFTDTFVIGAITVVDARQHTEDEIKQQTTNLIGKNILTIQPKVIETSIVGSISQIQTVRVQRKLPSALKIVVQEKQPALLLLSNNKYYFIDKGGIAYEEASLDRLPGIVLPTLKNTSNQGELVIGAPAVSESFVTFILDAEKAIPDTTGAQIAEIRIPSLAAREVHMLLDTNWLIRFDTSRPLEGQLDVLKRLLSSTIPGEKHADIEYIDLRIPNRVYYKLRGLPIE